MERLKKILQNYDAYISNYSPDFSDYLLNGTEKSFELSIDRIRRFIPYELLDSLIKSLHPSTDLSEIDLRIVRFMITLGHASHLYVWMAPILQNEKGNEDSFRFFIKLLDSYQVELPYSRKLEPLEFALRYLPWERENGSLNSAGRFILESKNDDIKKTLKDYHGSFNRERLPAFLDRYFPDRIFDLLDELILIREYGGGKNSFVIAKDLIDLNPAKYVEPVLKAWERIPDIRFRFAVGCDLSRDYPDLFKIKTEECAVESLKLPMDNGIGKNPSTWLLEQFGNKYFDFLFNVVKKVIEESQPFPKNVRDRSLDVPGIVGESVRLLGATARPMVLAAFDYKIRDSFFAYVGFLIGFNHPDDTDRIVRYFQEKLNLKTEVSFLRELLKLLRSWKPELLRNELEALLQHKSKPTRELAAQVLGTIGEAMLEPAQKLLGGKKAEARMNGVIVLAGIKTDKAIELLENHLDKETDDDVRDRILAALESVWTAQGKTITMDDIRKRIERSRPAWSAAKWDWIDPKGLPLLCIDGNPLDPDTVRYLLYRQSRAKGIAVDLEAKALLKKIDRKTGGDFALAVLKAFLSSKTEAADRWGMSLPCILGDDRLVPLLSKQIPLWAESQRVKMAEYAALSLALLGTDTALSVISRLILKYSTKRKNIGTASEQAFAEVARARGMTLDELGDRVVPWLGFEPNKPRTIEVGSKHFEVRISNGFKVVFFDPEKKKPVASLPKTASKESTEEIKLLKDSLKEVLKGQTPRIENLMVLQYRWPVELWLELYPPHPILRVFSCRLAWGEYDAAGNRTKTFRLLEDGTLTDFEDDIVTLDAGRTVGVVHPLELDAETLNRWRVHFADYEIIQPFPQLDRRVVSPTDEEKALRFAKNWFDKQINGLTFNGRAEKLGWGRDPYCEGGYVEYYEKHFRQSNVVGIVAVKNMPVYGMDETITVRDVYFAKIEKKGEYDQYPIPCDGDVGADDRILSFENVPPIAFSEIMADMEKIVGA